jgi:hypothetical protein
MKDQKNNQKQSTQKETQHKGTNTQLMSRINSAKGNNSMEGQ